MNTTQSKSSKKSICVACLPAGRSRILSGIVAVPLSTSPCQPSAPSIWSFLNNLSKRERGNPLFAFRGHRAILDKPKLIINMTEETCEFNEHDLKKVLHEVSYLDREQEELILKALMIKQRECDVVDAKCAEKLLKELEKQELISSSNRRDILKKLYADK